MIIFESYSIIIKLFSAFLTEVLFTAAATAKTMIAKTAAVITAAVTVVLLRIIAESSGMVAIIMKTNKAIYITNPKRGQRCLFRPTCVMIPYRCPG